MVVLYIESSTPEFEIQLDPPLESPQWIVLRNACVGIPSKLFPPEEIHVKCNLINTESVRYSSNGQAQRSDLLAILHKAKSNQIAFHGTTRPRVLTKSLKHVYKIKFCINYPNGTPFPFSPEKTKLEVEVLSLKENYLHVYD